MGDSAPAARGDGGGLPERAFPVSPERWAVLCLGKGTSVVGGKVMVAERRPVPVCAYVTCISRDSRACRLPGGVSVLIPLTRTPGG